VSRYRVFFGGIVELDQVPGLDDVTGDQPAQLEGVTTKSFLHSIGYDMATTIQIDYEDPEGSDVWHTLAYKRGLGGWE
jgi:hypothetical protein